MEQLSAESALRMVVEKKGGLAGALAPHSKFTVQLCANECGNFGLEVNFDIMEVVNVIEDGLVAWWNVNHPFRAIVVGDRIVEINGEVQPAGMQEALLASEVDLVMMRNTKSKTGLATYGTFGVRLVGSAQLDLELVLPPAKWRKWKPDLFKAGTPQILSTSCAWVIG